MYNRRVPRVCPWLLLASALCPGACGQRPEQRAPLLEVENVALTYGPRNDGDAVVARVGGSPIYQSDVQRQAEASGLPPAQALEDLVTLEALAQRAATRPWAKDAAAREGVRHLLAQAYVQREIEPKLGLNDVPESLLRQAYDRTRKGHVHGRLVRVALLQLYTPAKAGPDRRAQAAGWAKELAAWAALKDNRALEKWRMLPQTPPWTQRQLSFGAAWVEAAEAYSPELNAAIQALTEPAQATGLVEDPYGFHVGLYLGERAAQNVSFEQAAPRLRQALHEPWRQRRFLELTDQVASKAGLQWAAPTTEK